MSEVSETCENCTLDARQQAEMPDPLLGKTPAELQDEISRLAAALFDQTAKLDVAVIENGRLKAELNLSGNMLRAAHKEIADLTYKETQLLVAHKAIAALKAVIEPFADAWRNGIRFHGETSMKQYIGADDFKAAFDIIEGTGTIDIPVNVPPGFLLVPAEPTEAMLRAGHAAARAGMHAWADKIYRAMIAAAPLKVRP